jgi:hypothetical protein
MILISSHVCYVYGLEKFDPYSFYPVSFHYMQHEYPSKFMRGGKLARLVATRGTHFVVCSTNVFFILWCTTKYVKPTYVECPTKYVVSFQFHEAVASQPVLVASRGTHFVVSASISPIDEIPRWLIHFELYVLRTCTYRWNVVTNKSVRWVDTIESLLRISLQMIPLDE